MSKGNNAHQAATITTNIKSFSKSRSNFKVKLTNYGTMAKVLSQGIHKCNMKASGLCLVVSNTNIERVKGIPWHNGHEINMHSTRSPSMTSGDWGLDKSYIRRQNTCVYRYFLHVTRLDAMTLYRTAQWKWIQFAIIMTMLMAWVTKRNIAHAY